MTSVNKKRCVNENHHLNDFPIIYEKVTNDFLCYAMLLKHLV